MTNNAGNRSAAFLLAVDDNPALRDVLQEIFHYAGYRVGVAASADQAIKILKTAETLPKLIICDLLMPKTDGYQFMLAVRSEAAWQDIPFLFISGQEATILFDHPISTGVVGYLSKPFSVDDMLTIVAQVVESQ